MTGITSTGIGSGLDVNGLVQQLVTAEGQAASQRLIQRETQFQSRLSAYGSLKSSLEGFKTAIDALQNNDAVRGRTISSSNEDAISLTVTSDAVPASYSIDIESLATAARLSSASFTGADAAVGSGTLDLSIGTVSFSVTIDPEANTLADIRDAINNADDNAGVLATIINAESGSFLVLTGTRTGAANGVTVTQSTPDNGLSALTFDPGNGINNLTESVAAADARATVNGFTVTSETNTFDSVVDGVTFTALQETSGTAFDVTVKNDTSGLKGSIDAFVKAYNDFIDTADRLSVFDPDTNVAGALQGDSALRGATSRLRQTLSEATTTANPLLDTLNEVGVRLDSDGKLEVDSEALNTVLEDDFQAIERLFTGDEGYAARLTSVIDSYVSSDGIITARTDGIESSIETLGEQNERLQNRLISLEARLLRQFNGLDSLLANLNSTSSFLAAQLANVPTPGQS
ncbi:MAG: flagellar filament capping protein FliD [Pseudomonadota bacterium]